MGNEKEEKVCPQCNEVYLYDSKKHRRHKGLCEACYEELRSKREREVKVMRWKKAELANEEKAT